LNKVNKRDSEQTKKSILKAALEEFAELGYQGARVLSIANRAKVNKQMLYHYFGNKDDLFRTVLEQSYEKIRAHEANLNLKDLDPKVAIRKLVKFNFDYLAENPEFMRLLKSENLQRAVHIEKSDKIKHIHMPLVNLIETVLKQGADSGQFRKNVDPVQFYITVVGIAYFYLSNIHTLSAIFSRDLISKSAIDARLKHCEDVVLAYLKN